MTIGILHLVHRLTFGGTERVIVNLVRHSRENIRNFICSFKEYDEDFLREAPDTNSILCLMKREGNDLSIPFKIASFCRSRNIDIIHALGWGTYGEGLVASKVLMRKKFIFSFRGKTIEDTEKIPMRRVLAEKLFSTFCDSIVTPSEESRKEYANLISIDPSSIQVIYNGVDADRFKTTDSPLREMRREKMGIRNGEVVVGSVARFDPVKNMKGMVIAFSKLKEKERGKCKLLLVGDGPEFGKVQSLASDLDIREQVIFTGMRRDIPECLGIMDIYVQPSHFEGVPNSVLEAMASGLPIIATKVGGVPEIVKDRETGILVSLNDEGGLIKAVEFLVEDLEKRREMGICGQKRVIKLFSIEKMVNDYEKLYEQILQ